MDKEGSDNVLYSVQTKVMAFHKCQRKDGSMFRILVGENKQKCFHISHLHYNLILQH